MFTGEELKEFMTSLLRLFLKLRQKQGITPKQAWTKPIAEKHWQSLNFSQGKIYGFDLEKYQNAKVLMIGAGAIGSHVGLSLVRKGVGRLDLLDDDCVELRNLTRQLFSVKDIGKNKAECLIRILAEHGFFKTQLRGYPYRFQEALEMDIDLSCYHAIICGVDNNPTRAAVSKFCLKHRLPLIMSAVSRDGLSMYCIVQEPGKPCFGCIMPQAVNDDSYPCNLPGIIDIIQVVSGFTVYALDSILTSRNREWNARMVFLDGSVQDSAKFSHRRNDCHLCGGGS
jgi:molybdopterin-synthase adenylyltransferase